MSGVPSTECLLRLSDLASETPSWRPLVDNLRVMLAAAADERMPLALVPGQRETTWPLVAGLEIRVRTSMLAGWLETILPRVPVPVAYLPQMVGAAISQDEAWFGDDAEASVVAHHLAVPILHACRRHLLVQAREAWMSGGCPVCGMLATMAEERGLARERHLRCVRCGAGWPFPPYRCTACGDTDLGKRRSLRPGSGPARVRSCRIEACSACGSYLKVRSTLSALAPDLLAPEDLATVELDLVAREHGFLRARAERAWPPSRVVGV